MSTIDIDQLAYNLKGYKNTGKGAIVFLGAGASHSGNIPLSGKIIKDVLSKYCDSPKLKELNPEEKGNYYKVMDCLTLHDRKELFLKYIKDAKINITHIYLAQLMAAGYVDYILTVNFDNLTQRALSLFNIFPATYDIAMSKGLTTSTFNSPGVVFLHGQHHGFNLLNTEDEFKPVEELIVSSFQRICERPWIVVGYGATDPVFSYINKLGRFDNGLYWVCHKEEMPNENVMQLIEDTNKNASLIKGYNSDSFFQKLHNEIQIRDYKVPDPQILTKPFSQLQTLHDSIVEINDELPVVKERMEAAKRLVQNAIEKYENTDIESNAKIDNVKLDIILVSLINTIVKNDYLQLSTYEALLKDHLQNEKVKEALSGGYYNWATDLISLVLKQKNNTSDIYNDAFKKFQKATEINPLFQDAWINWGISLGRYAEIKTGLEKDKLYALAFEKYAFAVKLEDVRISHAEAKYICYSSWGIDLAKFALNKEGEERKLLFSQSLEKLTIAADLMPLSHEAWYNWGHTLQKFAEIQQGNNSRNLYRDAIKKYGEAIRLYPKYTLAWENITSALLHLSHLLEGEDKKKVLYEALWKGKELIDLSGNVYNYACANALLENTEEAFKYLEEALLKEQISFSYVETDRDWNGLREDSRYIKLKEQYSKM